MNMPTLVGYNLIQTESKSVQGVSSYDILFAGMSNVWKRYLFANPVTYGHCGIQNFWPLFAVIYKFSFFRGKNVLTRLVGTKICVLIVEVFILCP